MVKSVHVTQVERRPGLRFRLLLSQVNLERDHASVMGL